MPKSRKVPSWVWVLIGVITILVYLASAGKLNVGSGDNEEQDLEESDSESSGMGQTGGLWAPVPEDGAANAYQPDVGAKEPVQSQDPIPREVPLTSHIEDESVFSSTSRTTASTKEELKQRLKQRLKPLKKKARRIKTLTNVSFFIVRVLFAGVFAGYNILIIETNSMSYSLSSIAALAPYNTWMIVAIGVVLFVMYKSPSNLKEKIHKIHGIIESRFSARNPLVFQQVKQLEAEIEAFDKELK